MSDIDIYEVENGYEERVEKIDFGRLIVGGSPVTKHLKVKAKDKIEKLRLVVRTAGGASVSIGSSAEELRQVREGEEVSLTRGDGKDFLFTGEEASFFVKAEPVKGGSFSPEFELRYFVVPHLGGS